MLVGEFLALTGARLNGKELVAAGLATHFVPSEVRLKIFTQLCLYSSKTMSCYYWHVILFLKCHLYIGNLC